MQRHLGTCRRAVLRSVCPLSSLLLVLGGCDGTGPTGPSGPGPETVPAPATDDLRAFFVLQGSTLDDPEWPSRYISYRIVVCDPVLQEADLQRAREDLPKALFLAYANAQSVRINMHEDPYWQALSAAFDPSLAIRDLDTGAVVCLDDDVPSFIMGQPAAEILAAFHRDVTMATSFDGIYVDQCNLVYPAMKRDRLAQEHPRFDIDADGVADTPSHLDATYETWCPYFLTRLREEVGDAAILLGNSGGPLGNPALNGITLENVGYRFPVVAARQWLFQQRAVSRNPRMGVLWAINPLSWEPSELLAAEIPEVRVGDLTPRPQRGDDEAERRD